MTNIKSIVNAHNKRITNKHEINNKRTCNCINKKSCPLNGNCLSENTLYAGTITSNIPNYQDKDYAGVTAPQWKFRYNTHKTSFNLRKYINSSELSKEVWRIKDQGGTPSIKWRILKQHAPYNPISKTCKLCISEKLYILENEENLLNKRDELISKCRHQNKYTLNNHNHDNHDTRD